MIKDINVFMEPRFNVEARNTLKAIFFLYILLQDAEIKTQMWGEGVFMYI